MGLWSRLRRTPCDAATLRLAVVNALAGVPSIGAVAELLERHPRQRRAAGLILLTGGALAVHLVRDSERVVAGYATPVVIPWGPGRKSCSSISFWCKDEEL